MRSGARAGENPSSKVLFPSYPLPARHSTGSRRDRTQSGPPQEIQPRRSLAATPSPASIPSPVRLAPDRHADKPSCWQRSGVSSVSSTAESQPPPGDTARWAAQTSPRSVHRRRDPPPVSERTTQPPEQHADMLSTWQGGRGRWPARLLSKLLAGRPTDATTATRCGRSVKG